MRYNIDDLNLISDLIHKKNILWAPDIANYSLQNPVCIRKYYPNNLNKIELLKKKN